MTTENAGRSASDFEEGAPDGFHDAIVRVSAQLANDDVITREDIALLLEELHRRQHKSEAQENELRRLYDALHRSETWLSLTQQGVNVGTWEWDPRTNILIVTPEINLLHGATPGAIQTYQDWRQHIHPDDIFRVEAERDQAIAEHRPFDLEFRVIRDDGELRWIAGRGRAIYDEQGEVVRIIGLNQDITKQKRAELQIREQLAEITFYYDNAPIGLAVLDADLRFVRINKLLAEANGVRAAEHIGKTIEEIVPDLAAQGRAIAAKILDTGEPLTDIEISGETAAQPGITRFWKEGWYPIWRNDQTIFGFSVIAQEFTKTRQALEALKQSQQNLARAQKIGRLGSWEWDVVNQSLTWSDELYRIFGVTHDFPLTYASIETMLHPDDRAENQMRVQEALTTDDTTFEFRIIRPDGAMRYIAQHIVSSREDTGAPLKLFGVMQDITERKLADADREHLQRQLAQAQKMELVGQLAGGIAHEFNNLLAVILMRTELSLAQTAPATTLYHNLQTVYDTGQRAAELVRQLLGFAGKQIINPKVLDLNAIIEAFLPTLRKLTGDRIDLRWSAGAALWPVQIDQGQMEQVLTSLCTNARDAISGFGVITIETSNTMFGADTVQMGVTPGDYIMLTVTDTGSGMNEKTLSHIFEPFFTTKEVGKGSGLGLPMVHGIVEQNLGQIKVSSKPGSGTTFTIYLPRHAEKPVATPSTRQHLLRCGHGEAVLVVQDETMVLQLATEVLEFLGYEAFGVKTTSAALRWLADHHGSLSLLMTDLVLPEMSGVELARQMAAIQPGIRSIFLTDAPGDAVAELNEMAEDACFLQKPYSLQSLADTMRRVLGDAPVSLP